MPSYKFYKDSTGSKLEEKVNNLEAEYRMLQLYTLIVKPFDERFNVRLEIRIDNQQPITILLSQLTHGPTSESTSMLFFVDGVTSKFRPITLPATKKNIEFKVIPLPGAKDFELSLSCDYAISISKTIR